MNRIQRKYRVVPSSSTLRRAALHCAVYCSVSVAYCSEAAQSVSQTQHHYAGRQQGGRKQGWPGPALLYNTAADSLLPVRTYQQLQNSWSHLRRQASSDQHQQNRTWDQAFLKFFLNRVEVVADLQYFFLGIMFHLECQDRVDCPAGETSVGCNRRFFLQYGALLGAIDIRGSQPRR